MCTVLLPTGGYPIAVKYIISYNLQLVQAKLIEAYIFWKKNKWFNISGKAPSMLMSMSNQGLIHLYFT